MCKSIPGTKKHLTIERRIIIEKGLDQEDSLRSISLQIGKDPTTRSKEIKKYRSIQEHNISMGLTTNVLGSKTARLVESRIDINTSPENLIKPDKLASPLILHGQFPYMILPYHHIFFM